MIRAGDFSKNLLISTAQSGEGAPKRLLTAAIRMLSQSITAGQQSTTGFVGWIVISRKLGPQREARLRPDTDGWPRSTSRTGTRRQGTPFNNRPAAPAVYGRFSPTRRGGQHA